VVPIRYARSGHDAVVLVRGMTRNDCGRGLRCSAYEALCCNILACVLSTSRLTALLRCDDPFCGGPIGVSDAARAIFRDDAMPLQPCLPDCRRGTRRCCYVRDRLVC